MADPLPLGCTADELTTILRREGVLGDAQVRDVAVFSSNVTVLSHIFHLRLTYDGDVTTAPATLIVKAGHPERRDVGWHAAQREMSFYSEIAAARPGYCVPRCFDVFAKEETKSWHIVLEDLSETHRIATRWPLPPAVGECHHIVAGHARRQANCWDMPTLATLEAGWNWRDAAAAAQYIERLAAQVAVFKDRLGDLLSPARGDLYARLIEAAPRLGERYRSRRNLTIVQGDSHVWNCFLPRDGGEDVRFFDWDSWRIDVGASDLAYMIAMHWYPDRRRDYERPLLDQYHAVLLAAGVDGYPRSELDFDYRFAVLWAITWPVWQEAYGIPPVIWWNNLERIMLAVDDLGCRDLLD